MKKAKLLWIDLEMTGLEPEKDKILEVAAIATDFELNEIANLEAFGKRIKRVTTRSSLRTLLANQLRQ